MKKEQLKKNDDYITNRVLLVFGVTAVMLWGLAFLWKQYDYSYSYYSAISANNILLGVSVVGLVASLAWYFSSVRKGTFKKESVFNGAIAALFFAVLLFSLMLTKYDYTIARRLNYVILPAIAVLFLIYSTYQREFFVLCVTHSMLSLAIWIIAKGSGGAANASVALLATVAAFAVCAGAILLFSLSFKNKGKVKLGGFTFAVSSGKADKNLVYGVYAISAMLVALAYLLGAPWAYYILYAFVGFLVFSAVYFTVKLI